MSIHLFSHPPLLSPFCFLCILISPHLFPLPFSFPRSTLLPPPLLSPLHPPLPCPAPLQREWPELRQTCFSRQSWIAAQDSLSLHSELPVSVNGGQEAAVLGSGGRVGLGGEVEGRVRDSVGEFSYVLLLVGVYFETVFFSPTFLFCFVFLCVSLVVFFHPRCSLYTHSLVFQCICQHPPSPSLPQPPTPQRSWWACETRCGRRFSIIEFATPQRRVREVNCLLQLCIMHGRVAASAHKDRIFPLRCRPEDTKEGEGEGG